MIKQFLILLVLAGVLIGLVWIGVIRQERIECIEWQQQAEQYPDFYYADWQQEQCGI